MIFKSLYPVLITTPRWQLWALTLLILFAIPLGWYRMWYAPRKAASAEYTHLMQALSSINEEDKSFEFSPEILSPEHLLREVVEVTGKLGIALKKISKSGSENEPLSLSVAFEAPYENLAQLIAHIEKMPLVWLSFSMTETTLLGTLTLR